MSIDPICACHCGTRISLDQQLLQERQAWKEKYICLQKQAANDIGHLKENIYAQCSNLMQKQFTARELQQNKVVNAKNEEIKNLTSRVINLQTRIKILEKQLEIAQSRCRELEGQINEKDNAINSIKSKTVKSDREWENKLEEELASLRKKVVAQYQDPLQKLQAENQQLKAKVREFQKKYTIIIPEVEKLKACLASKSQTIEQLQGKLEKKTKQSAREVQLLGQAKDQIEKAHSGCRSSIAKLTDRCELLTQQLQKSKKIRKEVRVEPVYIERAVEVQKVVERIVEVQKIVKQYIEPPTFKDPEQEKENQRLKEEVDHLLRELGLMEERFKTAIHEYEQALKMHQQNAVKYKKEREQLVRTIEEQNKEIDMIHNYLEKRKMERGSGQPQKIIVHVNKDGSYQKTVERGNPAPTVANSKPPAPSKKR